MGEENEEQTKLLRSIVKLLLDREYEDRTEKDKVTYLAEAGFTHQEIANILNKNKSTVRTQASS